MEAPIPALTIGEKTARYAIVQGGMSVRISLAPLAAAVANAGGVGTIGGMILEPDELTEEIRQARVLTDGIVGVNLMYAGAAFDKMLDVCIREGVDFLAIGAGFARGPFRILAKAGIPAVPIISSPKAARLVARLPDIAAVVVEAGQAGGHLGPEDPEVSIWNLFPEVLSSLRGAGYDGPAIAAGGILNHQDIVRALGMGANGVQIGTRFAVSRESSAPDEMKQAWIAATGSQVEWWSPTGYASRAIVPHGDEGLPRVDGSGVRCDNCLKRCLHRQSGFEESHCIRQALVNSQAGNVREGLVFSGGRIGEISEVLTVDEIFKGLLGG